MSTPKTSGRSVTPTGVVLHDEIGPPGGRDPDLEDIDDVGMTGQPAHRPLFTEKSFEILVVEAGRQNLYRNRSVERWLKAAVDHSETTAAYLLAALEPRFQLSRDVA